MARILYSANSLLPDDIALFDFRELKTNANPRFAAISRCYTYNLHSYKMPFCRYRSQFYPYSLRPELLKKWRHSVLELRVLPLLLRSIVVLITIIVIC